MTLHTVLALILVYFVFSNLYKEIQSEGAGGGFKANVLKFGTCMDAPESSLISVKVNIAIQNCIHQCALRPLCTGLNYKRRFNLCIMFTGQFALIKPGKCIYISRDDIEPEIACTVTCSPGQICGPDNACVDYVSTDCGYPNVLDGTVLGNMFSEGNTQVIKCLEDWSVFGSASMKCLATGSWDNTPVCRKDCNPSDIANADIQTFENSSGAFANVLCHGDWIIKQPGDVAATQTTTIQCAFNGTWIPIPECIDGNNLNNFASLKPVYQSSTYNNYGAGRAVDGIWNPVFGDGSCSHTKENVESTAWWEIDLQQVVTVHQVKILNRESDYFAARFKDVTVTVGTTSNPTEVCGVYAGPATDSEMVNMVCQPPIVGQFVRLTKPNVGASVNLTMCEVGVY